MAAKRRARPAGSGAAAATPGSSDAAGSTGAGGSAGIEWFDVGR